MEENVYITCVMYLTLGANYMDSVDKMTFSQDYLFAKNWPKFLSERWEQMVEEKTTTAMKVGENEDHEFTH